MSPGEFAQKMSALLEKNDDPEIFHSRADEMIVELLKELGYSEGAKIFDEAEKWYA